MKRPNSVCVPMLAILLSATSASVAQQAGDNVRISGSITEDVYAAGATVEVDAAVDGDVVAAGGQVSIRERVSGDVMAAGGAVNLDANVGDDVRLAGGNVSIRGTVGDDAIAAGGSVTLASGSSVGGRAWLSGGHVRVAGNVGRELKAAGGRIVLSGRVSGDVELAGDEISILDGAVIEGTLVYRGPHEAEISDGAQISGGVEFVPVERPVAAVGAAAATVGLLALVGLVVTGIAFYLLFPHTVDTSIIGIRTEFWKCLGIGLAVFAATPVVIAILFTILIGWLPAVVMGPLYLILLLAGFLTGVFYAADLGLGWVGRGVRTRGRRIGSFLVALIVVTIIGIIPLLGALLLFVLMLLGAGALTSSMHRVYSAPSA